ncbi:MAG: BlaI/MecI/CopY family transcriptional regulator [Pseudobutyrivibrio sp.]|uniref:BlaI/MecI/CopY family transcriptional regulator n=1 Tax=Pseudobutyrivibrio sp. TaxID=2014367 RepID=UPI0025FF4733|nr:BlaI/MecI/CopY family transcriptional regulator [Pseudobutyrivibrio sp.]MBQ8489731.1 BlaI/MecI/CopY family transcriptional regulator [Pseudobutyrivibrio sp.]
MEKRRELKPREEALMNFLWEKKEPMTPNEMASELQKDGWSNVTVYKIVQALSEENYLEIDSFEKTAKTYARKLIPTISKEEYYSSLLMDKGFDSSAIAELTASFIGANSLKQKDKNKQVIKKLEEVISQLKGED